jgi:ribosomal protein S18 acetylase RimI-like enzyme
VTPAVPEVTLRPARDDDGAFLLSVYASTREEELAPVPWTAEQKHAFVAQQFAAQSAHYAQHYDGLSSHVVLVDGARAGRLLVARWPEEIRVVDIALLPDYRGRGVGERLLRPILEEADARGVATVIHVERTNPAMSFYRRLGFAPAGEHGIYFRMERSAAKRQAKTAS